jgi:hypothetical protein
VQTHEPAPARTLDSCGGGVKLLLESIEGTEVLDDGLAEGTILQGTTVPPWVLDLAKFFQNKEWLM